MKKPKLIVIEGFDRIGKDTFLINLKSHYQDINDKSKFVYIQNIPDDMPHYRSNPEGFKNFLIEYTKSEIKSIIDAVNNGADTIFMTRLFISDRVYSTLFNRGDVVDQFLQQILDVFDVYNCYFTFDGYDEYLKRLDILKDNEIEYTEAEFNKLDQLYMSTLDIYNKKYNMLFKIKYLKSNEWITINDVTDWK